MSWEAEIEELHKREAFADQLGGVEKVERQHEHETPRATTRKRSTGSRGG